MPGRSDDGTAERRTSLIGALIGAFVIFLIATFPATWLLMLFLGNVGPGLGLSYWGTLPLGILVSALLAGAASSRPA
jgi:hypothetical protein